MSQGFYATAQCERMLLANFVKKIDVLNLYCLKTDSDIFTTKQRAWIFLTIKKNYIQTRNLTSKQLFYVQLQQQLDQKQTQYGKAIIDQLDIIFDTTLDDNVQLIVNKIQMAQVASMLSNNIQTTYGYLSTGNVQQALDNFRKGAAQINIAKKASETTGLFSDSDQLLKDIVARKQNPEQYAGLYTGFQRFDKQTGGLFPAELTICFGLSGKGKSTFMKNICNRVSATGRNILFVPNEQNKRQVEFKFTSMMTNIPGWKFKRGQFSDQEYKKTQTFLQNKGNRGQIYIHPLKQGVDATVIQRVFNELKAKNIKIDLICVDYLDLMGSPFKTYSEWDEQGKITNSLKQLAIDCNVPVLTCTQAAIQSVKQQKKDNPFLDVDDVYGSKSKVHTANTLIGIVNKTASQDITTSSNPNEQKIHHLTFCICKNRDGANFAFKQLMYAQTGVMINDDESGQVSFDQAQAQLDAQLDKLAKMQKKFKKQDQNKNKVNQQLKNLTKSFVGSDDFSNQDFDYMDDSVSVSDEQVDSYLNQFDNIDQNIVKNDLLDAFLGQQNNEDKNIQTEQSQVQNNVDLQNTTIAKEEVKQGVLFEEEQNKSKDAAYELFKKMRKKQ